MVSRTSRICSGLVLAGLFAFVLLTALAAAAYPGGTFCEPAADSYRFWGNFFCDLTQPVTLRGVDNSLAQRFSEASFIAFSLALLPFFWLLGSVVQRRAEANHHASGATPRPSPGSRAVRALGAISALGTNVVAWLPSGTSPVLHQAAVFAATIPGLTASVLGLAALVSQALSANAGGTLRTSAVFGCAVLLFGVSDALGYAYAVAVPSQCYPWLPVLQKLAGLFLLAWMLSIARLGSKRVEPEI